MFKKMRLLLNKKTRISRITEFSKWVVILLFVDALLFLIGFNLFYIFDNQVLKDMLVNTLGIFFIGNIFLLIVSKDIYSYLYTTHPCTIRLNKEEEIALEKEEKIKKQLEASQKKLEEDAKTKAIEERAKKRKIRDEEKRKREEETRQRDATRKLDMLIRNEIQIKDAEDSLIRFLTLKEKNLNSLNNQERKEWLVLWEKEQKEQEEALNNSPLVNYFGAIEGGETILYYLKLKNKFGETRYKIGVTLNSVEKRYSGKSDYKILYEEKLTHANTIEKKILKKFNHLVTDESLLGTNGTEILKEDVLKLDTERPNI